jgi:hypothetical protein
LGQKENQDMMKLSSLRVIAIFPEVAIANSASFSGLQILPSGACVTSHNLYYSSSAFYCLLAHET